MNIQVIKSRRRTIGIEVHADGKVIVRTPLRMSSAEINRFIDEHEDWIRQKLDFVRQKSDNRHGTGALGDRKSTRLNSSHQPQSRMPSSA